MGLILPQKTKVKWTGNTRKYYESKGYFYTKNLDEFEVNVQDLTKGSTAIVNVKCDFCGLIKQMKYKEFLCSESELYCCPKCLSHKKRYRNEDGKICFIEVPYRNKEWLYNEYVTKNRQAKEIAKEYSVNLRTLMEWVLKFGLTKRRDLKKEIPKEKLYEMYFVQHMTSEEIGRKYNLCGNTVISLIREYGYQIPSRSEFTRRYYTQKGGYEKIRKTQSTMENRIKTSCRQRGIAVEDFKGFSSTEEHMARNNTYYKEWVRGVFQRDNYTCQCCGRRGGNLNAHHLYNFSQYKELRYDINNGITFCEQCHLIKYPNSFHSIYGEKNNTPEQVKEFIQKYKQQK